MLQEQAFDFSLCARSLPAWQTVLDRELCHPRGPEACAHCKILCVKSYSSLLLVCMGPVFPPVACWLSVRRASELHDLHKLAVKQVRQVKFTATVHTPASQLIYFVCRVASASYDRI